MEVQHKSIALDATCLQWADTLCHALRKVENWRRVQKDLPAEPNRRVFIPRTDTTLLRLMNLRVWSIRYCVSPEFILDVLTTAYAYKRKPSKATLVLGLPVGTITGPHARRIVEQAAVRAYPNRENFMDAKQPPARLPIEELSCEEPDEFVQRYMQRMDERRAERTAVPVTEYKRKFRRVL